MDHKYNIDYYEDGIKKNLSGYENYRYIPMRTIPEARTIIDRIPFNTAMDFGAAKGFLVHALNLLGKYTYGYDISEYAVSNCMPQVKDKMKLIRDVSEIDVADMQDLVIAKDVLEHLPEEEIRRVLSRFAAHCHTLFVVVPLGENGHYRIPFYDRDVTHVIRENEEWWINIIKDCRFNIKSFDYEFGNIKSRWYAEEYKYGNAFIVATTARNRTK